MQVVALSPFGVGTLLWQPEPEAWTLTAIVKVTYALADGEASYLAERQEPVGGDQYHEGDPGQSLARASDFVPFKRGADVVLTGHAYAPRGEPVVRLVARVTVGEWSKSIGLHGDRIWWQQDHGLRAGAPRTFNKMPLRYELATRGPANPVGLDPSVPPVPGALALPNLEAVDGDAESIAGFGPVAPGWAARQALRGGAPLAWAEGGGGIAPPGFDFGFFNCAPRDQQLEMLRVNAPIVLENLHPEQAELRTQLAPVRPKVFLVDPSSGRATEIAMRCDTLVIDTDAAVATLTWRGLGALVDRKAASSATLVVASEARGREIRARHLERLLKAGGELTRERLESLVEDRDELAVRHDGLKGNLPPASLEDHPTRVPESSGRRVRVPAEPQEGGGQPIPVAARPDEIEPDPQAGSSTTGGLAARQPTLSFDPLPSEAPHSTPAPEPEMPLAQDAAPQPDPAPLLASGGLAHASVAILQRFDDPSTTNDDDREKVSATAADAPARPAALASPVELQSSGPESARDRRPDPTKSLTEYARLAVLVERGEVSRALADYAIHLGELMKLQRAWTQRVADDPGLAKALSEAMDAARWE